MTFLHLTLIISSLCASYLAFSVPPSLNANSIVKEPEFCHELDCPRYTVLRTYKTYELRRYLPSMWVTTQVQKMDLTDKDRRAMFDKLFYYISGNNTEHMDIPMTTPVLQTVFNGKGPDCESTFKMQFMMPFSLQNSPPKPTAKDVNITTLPQMDVYVRAFGGFMNGSVIEFNLIQLASDINGTNKYIANPFYFAGYDNPNQILNRHNEVWLRAKE